jgi:hypothetical protein
LRVIEIFPDQRRAADVDLPRCRHPVARIDTKFRFVDAKFTKPVKVGETVTATGASVFASFSTVSALSPDPSCAQNLGNLRISSIKVGIRAARPQFENAL